MEEVFSIRVSFLFVKVLPNEVFLHSFIIYFRIVYAILIKGLHFCHLHVLT